MINPRTKYTVSLVKQYLQSMMQPQYIGLYFILEYWLQATVYTFRGVSHFLSVRPVRMSVQVVVVCAVALAVAAVAVVLGCLWSLRGNGQQN